MAATGVTAGPNELIKVDAHFVRSTSLLSNRTALKIGDYILAAAPAMISVGEIRLLVVLQASELFFFTKQRGAMCTLVMDFDRPGFREATRYIVRVSLEDIANLAGRADVCMVTLKVRSMPPELSGSITAYLKGYIQRKCDYELKGGAWVEMDEKGRAATGIDAGVELEAGPLILRLLLLALSPAKAKVLVPQGAGSPPNGAVLRLRLFFHSAPILVECSLPQDAVFAPGDLELELAFSNDLLAVFGEHWKRAAWAAASPKRS